MANTDDSSTGLHNDSRSAPPAYLVIDTESIPDGRLVSRVKYPKENLSPEEAVQRAQADFKETSWNNSEFLPVTFQIPIAVCVIRVASDFTLQAMTCLDAPQFRPSEIVKKFWQGIAHYKARLVTFNGRAFDMPLLEMAALRYGCAAREYCQNSRNRFNGPLDLLDWIGNFGAFKITGGLDLLAKMLGKPGKMDVAGHEVYKMYLEGRLQEINDYCLCDTLDTYFVFLRTRVLSGDISLEREAELIGRAKESLEAKTTETPVLRKYLDAWTELPSP